MTDYISLALICSIVGAAVAYVTLSRNKSKDDKSEGKQDGVLFTEIGTIKGGINDIKVELREQRKTNTEFVERLAKVEASAKQAHRRIDRVEGRVYPGEEGEHHE